MICDIGLVLVALALIGERVVIRWFEHQFALLQEQVIMEQTKVRQKEAELPDYGLGGLGKASGRIDLE